MLKVGKYDYTLHPESRKLKESRASYHIPEWRSLPETPEPDFSREYSGFCVPAVR